MIERRSGNERAVALVVIEIGIGGVILDEVS